MTKLAKLILHYNTPELTQQLCKLVPDAIVIDNGSDKFPYTGKNRCIRQGNFGFTRGWNEGVKALYDEFDAFWLMNSDIRIDAKSVKRVEQIVDEQPNILFFTPAYNCWMKHCQPIPGKKLLETNIMEFTAPVIRKEVFERIGFFDEIFARGYGVEFDFCYRARQAGITLYVDHASRFYHLGQQTISKHEGLLAYSAKANFELTHGLMSRYGDDYMGIVFKGLDIKTDFEMKIAVYVTIFGNYDQIKEIPKQEVNADYFVITDNPHLKVQGWKTIVPDFPRHDLHPRLRAKFFKMFPWEVADLAKYEISIYIDASIRITSANFVGTCIKNLHTDMLMFKHPQRNCIYAEGKASVGLKKYEKEPLAAQLAAYRKFHPVNGGLWAGGVIVRKHSSEIVKKVMGDWWFENMKYSYQDQLSLPVVFRANNFKPSVFAENQYINSFLQVEWHDDKEAASSKPQAASFNKQSPITNGQSLITNNQLSNDNPLFTVLMPVWKTPIDKLRKAIDSILGQRCKDFELLIVDDNNQDNALLDELKNCEQNPKVRIIRTRSNDGLAHTLDFGIAEARGSLIVRMDSDDVAHLDLLECHRLFFERNRQVAICGVQLNLIKPDGTIQSATRHPTVVNRDYAFRSRGYWFVNHPGICYRKDVVQNLGGYGDTPAHLAEDYVLWCKFLKSGCRIYNLPNILIDYSLGDGSQIGQQRKSDKWTNHLEETRLSLIMRSPVKDVLLPVKATN